MSENIRRNDEKQNIQFFDNQIEHHLYWRKKVESFFSNPAKDHVLPALISDDHHCQLGYWINSKASQDYADLAPFHHIREIHTDFHQTANKVMLLIMQGEIERAESLKQHFFRLSDKIVECLNELKKPN